METPSNETTLELEPLVPGTCYSVVVQGRNQDGLGGESVVVQVITMLGLSAPPPTGVSASLQIMLDGTAIVTVQWMVSGRGGRREGVVPAYR